MSDSMTDVLKAVTEQDERYRAQFISKKVVFGAPTAQTGFAPPHLSAPPPSMETIRNHSAEVIMKAHDLAAKEVEDSVRTFQDMVKNIMDPIVEDALAHASSIRAEGARVAGIISDGITKIERVMDIHRDANVKITNGADHEQQVEQGNSS